ncbi:MAG: sigma-70 family RNA polymerase sigma factor [Planctomycetales bacterium]
MKANFQNDRHTDAQLMDQFYGGDRAAFDELTARMWPSLIHQALQCLPLHLIGRMQTAEDLVQQTLLKSLTTLDRPEIRWQQAKGAVSTWMGTILRNFAISHLRSRASKTLVCSDLAGNERESNRPENRIIDHRLSAEAEIRRSETTSSRRQLFFGKLPAEIRSILEMKMEGKSHRQIAEQLGVSRATISYRIRSATMTLRSMDAV